MSALPRRPAAYKAAALLTELTRRLIIKMVRVEVVETSSQVWKTCILTAVLHSQSGLGDPARTDDLDFPKVARYQLRHTQIEVLYQIYLEIARFCDIIEISVIQWRYYGRR